MSNHDSHSDSSEKFVPLADNNNNLALGKVLPLLISLALVVWGIMMIVKNVGGYLRNEEQVEWRREHQKAYKDSDQNSIYYDKESSGSKDEMKDNENKKTEENEEPKHE